MAWGRSRSSLMPHDAAGTDFFRAPSKGDGRTAARTITTVHQTMALFLQPATHERCLPILHLVTLDSPQEGDPRAAEIS